MSGAADATSSLWVRPPSAFDCACAVRPPLLDPLPRWGRGIRKRKRTPHLCHSGARPPSLLPLHIAWSSARNPGNERASSAPLASPAKRERPRSVCRCAGEGAGRRNQHPHPFDSACAPRVLLSLSPWGERGGRGGGRWRHLEPVGVSPLSLRLRLRAASPLSSILSPGGGEESGKGGGRPTAVISARAARSCLPLPLGGEGRVRGAAGATSSPWIRPPSPFDSACAVRPPSP